MINDKAKNKTEVAYATQKKEKNFTEEILRAKSSVKKYGTFSGDIDLLSENIS